MTTDTQEKTIAAPDTEDRPEAEQQNAAPAGGTASPNASSGDTAAPRRSRIRSFWSSAEHKTVVYVMLALGGLLLYLVVNLPAVTDFFRKTIGYTRPVILGAVIAYLCDPILMFYEYNVFRKIRNGNARRGLSLFCTLLTVLLAVILVIIMIVPQLINSITDLVENYEAYLDGMLAFLQGIVDKLPVHVDISSTAKLRELIEETYGSMNDFLELEIMPAISRFLENFDPTSIFDTITSLLNVLKDLILAMFIAFYILGSKDKRRAQVAKARKALFSETQDARLGSIVALVDKSFGGFISGKLIDSLIIGLLTYVLLIIFRVSNYNLLIATFVGVTNIIPVFGPFIGAIPSFLIVLISNPSKALLFLVLVLIIQQLDGNVIGPKILGDNTGVSSLAVIIAITVCGALWGIVGMLIGVPLFAVVIELVKRYLESRLRAKGEATDTVEYYPKDAVGNAEQDVYYEHATLRYKYEHSKLKPQVDKVVAWAAARLPKKKKKDKALPENQTDSLPESPVDTPDDKQ